MVYEVVAGDIWSRYVFSLFVVVCLCFVLFLCVCFCLFFCSFLFFFLLLILFFVCFVVGFWVFLNYYFNCLS